MFMIEKHTFYIYLEKHTISHLFEFLLLIDMFAL